MDKSPDAFRTISEVADHLETPAHVLRFWESRFPQIRPVKRAGGRRYYRPTDVALLTGIKRLLHDEGLTIRGVQKILREQGVRHVAGLSGIVLSDDADIDAEAALEVALASFARPAPNDAEPVEPESAQIFALESALRRGAAQQPPAADPAPSPEAGPEVTPESAPESAIADLFTAEPAATSPADLLNRLRALPPGALHGQIARATHLQDRLRTLLARMQSRNLHPNS